MALRQLGQSIREGGEGAIIDSFGGEYRFLSNFYPAAVYGYDDNERYPTVEHAFQATKTMSDSQRETIREADTPGRAKSLGRQATLRKDWERIKIKVMRYLLVQKFSTEPLRQKLLDTGDAQLIEGNMWRDRIWGMTRGGDGTWVGENHLGRLLMLVRDDLRKPTESVDEISESMSRKMRKRAAVLRRPFRRKKR